MRSPLRSALRHPSSSCNCLLFPLDVLRQNCDSRPPARAAGTRRPLPALYALDVPSPSGDPSLLQLRRRLATFEIGLVRNGFCSRFLFRGIPLCLRCGFRGCGVYMMLVWSALRRALSLSSNCACAGPRRGKRCTCARSVRSRSPCRAPCPARSRDRARPEDLLDSTRTRLACATRSPALDHAVIGAGLHSRRP